VVGFALTLFKEWQYGRERSFYEATHGTIDKMDVKRCCIDGDIGFQPFGKQLPGHIVFVQTPARGFGPARIAADAMFNIFFTKVHNLDIGSGLLHPFDKMIEHEFGFALAAGSGTGIDCQYFHAALPFLEAVDGLNVRYLLICNSLRQCWFSL
jgi:hypothetical protein